MTLSFPMWRLGEIKICGPIIDEALKRGHKVIMVWKRDIKPGEAVNFLALVNRWPMASVSATPRGIYFVPLAAVNGVTVPEGVKVVSLDYCLNHLAVVKTEPCALTTFTSEWEVERTVVHPTRRAITGDASLDGVALTSESAARQRWGFGDKPVIVVFAPKFKLPGNHWRRYVYRWLGYRSTLNAVREYCNTLGALMVIKTRQKHGDPWYRFADLTLTDQDLYPATTTQLLAATSLAIHWQSGAVYEGVVAGVPQLSIRIPQPHLQQFPSSRWLYGDVPYESPQRWTGVVTSVDWRDVVSALRHPGLLDIFPFEQRRYVKELLGGVDGGAAGRVLDAVESL